MNRTIFLSNKRRQEQFLSDVIDITDANTLARVSQYQFIPFGQFTSSLSALADPNTPDKDLAAHADVFRQFFSYIKYNSGDPEKMAKDFGEGDMAAVDQIIHRQDGYNESIACALIDHISCAQQEFLRQFSLFQSHPRAAGGAEPPSDSLQQATRHLARMNQLYWCLNYHHTLSRRYASDEAFLRLLGQILVSTRLEPEYYYLQQPGAAGMLFDGALVELYGYLTNTLINLHIDCAQSLQQLQRVASITRFQECYLDRSLQGLRFLLSRNYAENVSVQYLLQSYVALLTIQVRLQVANTTLLLYVFDALTDHCAVGSPGPKLHAQIVTLCYHYVINCFNDESDHDNALVPKFTTCVINNGLENFQRLDIECVATLTELTDQLLNLVTVQDAQLYFQKTFQLLCTMIERIKGWSPAAQKKTRPALKRINQSAFDAVKMLSELFDDAGLLVMRFTLHSLQLAIQHQVLGITYLENCSEFIEQRFRDVNVDEAEFVGLLVRAVEQVLHYVLNKISTVSLKSKPLKIIMHNIIGFLDGLLVIDRGTTVMDAIVDSHIREYLASMLGTTYFAGHSAIQMFLQSMGQLATP